MSSEAMTKVLVAGLAVALACGCGTDDDSKPSAEEGGGGAMTGGAGGTDGAGRGGAAGAGTSSGGQGDGGTSTSGGGTAGSSTGGVDNDPGLGGPARCEGSDLLVCDSFENGLDASVWETLLDHEGVVAIDAARAARGSSSFKATASGGGASLAMILHRATLPTPTNNLNVRVFVYTDGPFPTQHMDLLEAQGDQELPWVALAMGDDMASGKYENLYHGVEVSDVALFPDDPPMMPTGRWVCLEWELLGATNEIVTYLDGEELTQITVRASDEWDAPVYTSIAIGVFNIHEESAPEFEFWFDDVAIDDSRIGCGR